MMQMGRLSDSSIQLRLWENKQYSDSQRRKELMKRHVQVEPLSGALTFKRKGKLVTNNTSKIPRAKSFNFPHVGRFETKEDQELAPEKQVNLNRRVEPKQNGDTDEPETPNSELGDSPDNQQIRIDIENVEVSPVPTKIERGVKKRDSNSRLAEKRGLQISDLRYTEERLKTSPKEEELKINLLSSVTSDAQEANRYPRPEDFASPLSFLDFQDQFRAPAPFEIIPGAKPEGDAVDMYSNPVTPYTRKGGESDSQGDSGVPQFVESELNEKLLAECYISFDKILRHLMTFSARKEQHIADQSDIARGELRNSEVGQNRNSEALKQVVNFVQEKEFTDQLWYCGHQIGTVSGTLRFINLPYLQQMKIGVLTNDGINYSRRNLIPETSFTEKDKKSQHPQDEYIGKLIGLKDKLTKHDRWITRLEMKELSEIVKQLKRLLGDNEYQKVTYSSEKTLIKAQVQFIELGKHALEFCEWVSEILRESYYNILILVLQRNELDLGQMGFLDDSKIPDKVMKAKLQVAQEFQVFVYQALETSIKSMKQRGIERYKRDFICQSLALSFFRVPEFQEIFIQLLEKEEILDICSEYQAQFENLFEDADIQDATQKKAIAQLFNWEKYCYSKLPQSQSEQTKSHLKTFFQRSGEWDDRIRGRKSVFFQIITAWMEYVKRTLVQTEFIKWTIVPGYKQITQALLEMLEEQEVIHWTDAQIEATQAFLVNGNLLWFYVRTAFLKTSIRDVPTTIKTMQITSKWFLKMYTSGILIPPNFDFTFFLKGIQMLLDLDHGTSTAKVLWLLYQIMHVIPKKEREELIKYLLEPKTFYSLFFHWSWTVRMCFYYFYYFQLHRILIDSKEVENELHRSLTSQFSKIDQNIEDVKAQKVQNSGQKEKALGKIPRHENLPADHNAQKKAPKMLDEIRYFESSTHTINEQKMKETRLLKGPENSVVMKLFDERVREIESLRLMCKKIKDFIKQHKQLIIECQKDDMFKMDEVAVSKRRLLIETAEEESNRSHQDIVVVEQKLSQAHKINSHIIPQHALEQLASIRPTLEQQRKQGSQLQIHGKQSLEEEFKGFDGRRDRSESSDSFLSAGQSSTTTALIEAYTLELAQLRDSVMCFSVAQFANASDEFLLKLGEKIAEEKHASETEANQTRKKKVRVPTILTQNMKTNWNQIMNKIPESKQVYVQSSLSQLKGIQRDYQDWVNTNTNEEFFPDQNGPSMSVQGLTGKMDFPTVIVRVHDDAGELQAADDWDK